MKREEIVKPNNSCFKFKWFFLVNIVDSYAIFTSFLINIIVCDDDNKSPGVTCIYYCDNKHRSFILCTTKIYIPRSIRLHNVCSIYLYVIICYIKTLPHQYTVALFLLITCATAYGERRYLCSLSLLSPH